MDGLGLRKCRVVAVYKGMYKISDGNEEQVTGVTGNYANRCVYASDFPTVGDWVMVDQFGYIVELVERNNRLSRRAAGKRTEEQLIAANIDYMFIVTSLNQEFNMDKLERYMMLAEMNNIKPVLIFTKSDLCGDTSKYVDMVKEQYQNAMVLVTSSYGDIGIQDVKDVLSKGKTGVFVGASGVGKSTLVNKLMGEDVMKTSEIREYDAQGRHTTTHRELFELDNGAFIIDTPGIREIGFWAGGGAYTGFEDVELLAAGCRFRNCSHTKEEGCAVKRAVQEGVLSKERYMSYIKRCRVLYRARLAQNEGDRLKFKSKVKRQCKNERYTKK